MTDTSWFTSTADSAIITSFAANTETNLADARLCTVLVTAGSLTLTKNYETIFVDATASVTISLPDTATTGDGYRVMKYDTTASTLTVGRNGENINGTAADLSTTTSLQGWYLQYSGNTSLGWWAETLTGA